MTAELARAIDEGCCLAGLVGVHLADGQGVVACTDLLEELAFEISGRSGELGQPSAPIPAHPGKAGFGLTCEALCDIGLDLAENVDGKTPLTLNISEQAVAIDQGN